MYTRRATQAGFQALWLVITLAAIGGLIWYGLGPGGWFRAQVEAGLVGAEVQRGPLRISVTDTGGGIPEAMLRDIFNPFFTTRAQGTGLGLAVTRKIIEDHGGRLSVVVEPGSHTRFNVDLPVVPTG